MRNEPVECINKPLNQDGFSLVELVVVIFFAGLLVVPLYGALIYMTQLGPNSERIEEIRVGLGEHLRVFGVLPCPAPLATPMGAPGYDVANCAAATVVPGVNGGNVLVGAVPIDDLRLAMDCRIAGDVPVGLPDNIAQVFRKSLRQARDVLDPPAPGVSIENVKTDSVQCISKKHMVDEYHNKILYVVSADATNINTFQPFNPLSGQIRIIDPLLNQVTSLDQQFLILSFGENGRGAVNSQGILNGTACGTVGPGNPPENENCNYNTDAVFMSSLRSMAEGTPFYYDDEMDFSLAGSMKEDNFWSWGAHVDPNQRNVMVNPNVNVRMIIDQVETPNAGPMDKLVVNRGDMRVGIDSGAGGILRATEVNDAAGVNQTGGTVRAINNVAVGIDARANNSVIAEKYCYDSTC